MIISKTKRLRNVERPYLVVCYNCGKCLEKRGDEIIIARFRRIGSKHFRMITLCLPCFDNNRADALKKYRGEFGSEYPSDSADSYLSSDNINH